MPLFLPPVEIGRWLPTVLGGPVSTSSTFTVGRVNLTQFVVPVTCQIDGLAYVVGTTQAGNVIGGIVGPITKTADTATGAVVVAQSASTLQSAINAQQVLTWTAVTVRPGIYYAALEGDDATGTFMRYPNLTQGAGLGTIYDRAGGYGALTDPTPSVSLTGTAAGFRVRVASQ